MRKSAIIINTSLYDTGVSTYIKSILFSIKNDDRFIVLARDNSWKLFLNGNYYFKLQTVNYYLPYFYKLLIFMNCKNFGQWFFEKFDPLGHYLKSSKINFCLFPTPCYLTFLVEGAACVSIHDLMHITERRFDESSSFFKTIYRNNLYKNIGNVFNKIIFESKYGYKMYLDNYKLNRNTQTFIVPYSCPNSIIEIIERKLFLEFNTKMYGDYLFYPASFWKHKNHKNLLFAFLNVIKKGHDIKLVFSGGLNKEYKHIKELVVNLGLEKNIFFTGYVNETEIVALYFGAKALIMPTFFGPTNIPPIEAIYCNTPVLISDIYGMKEQLQDSALYFDPNSILDIERVLLNFFKSDIDKLIENGKKLKSKFSPKNFNISLINALDAN